MNRAPLAVPVAELQIFLWRSGWAWPLALLAGGVALALVLGALRPAQDAVGAARKELAEAIAAQAVRPATPPPGTDAQQVQAVRAALRGTDDPAVLIRRMAELARAEQITLPQGEYQQQKHAETGLVLLHVTQPVKAGYPQVKRYVESVLRTMPNVSLDQVAARRDNVAQAQLDVRLRWTFWVQPGEAAK